MSNLDCIVFYYIFYVIISNMYYLDLFTIVRLPV